MLTLITVSLTLFLIAALASAEKSPPRKLDAVAGARPEAVAVGDSQSGDQRASSSASAPCDVPCLEAKNAALQKLAVKRLKGWRKAERQREGLKRVLRTGVKTSTDGVTRGFQCIHRFEGSWTDSGAPYWGGLQMDENFMGTYGYWFRKRLGTADHWPAFLQIAVAMNAYYAGRGYGPWPNTRRMCGL